MRFFTLLAPLLVVFLLSACSDTPGERKLQQLLQQQFDQQYQGLADIEQLKKLNGWADNDNEYTAEVTYNIAFKQSFKDYMDQQTSRPGNPLEKMASGMSAGLLKLQYGDFKAGDSYQVKQQTLTLRMTENGWALSN